MEHFGYVSVACVFVDGWGVLILGSIGKNVDGGGGGRGVGMETVAFVEFVGLADYVMPMSCWLALLREWGWYLVVEIILCEVAIALGFERALGFLFTRI
jgi:hypothetical protein